MWRMEDYAVLPNGNFIRGCNAMSHRISTTEPNSNHWLIISDSLTAINKICEHNILIEIPNYLVPSFNGAISFLPAMSDTIYTVNNDGYYPTYIININKVNKFDIKSMGSDDDINVLGKKETREHKTFTWGGFAQTDKFIHFSLGFFANRSLFYSKESDKSVIMDCEMFTGVITSDENGKFWAYIDPQLAVVSNGNYFKEMLSYVNEEDNPVLVCFDLKDF